MNLTTLTCLVESEDSGSVLKGQGLNSLGQGIVRLTNMQTRFMKDIGLKVRT